MHSNRNEQQIQTIIWSLCNKHNISEKVMQQLIEEEHRIRHFGKRKNIIVRLRNIIEKSLKEGIL